MGADDYDVFICFAEPEGEWVRGYLLPALEAAGVSMLVQDHVVQGARALAEFERGVATTARTLLVLSPAFLKPGFTDHARVIAQAEGIEEGFTAVVPLVRHPVDLPIDLRALETLDMTREKRWDRGLTKLLATLGRPAPRHFPPPVCPYPGMRPFPPADAERFLGREEETKDLVGRVAEPGLVLVIGPSGCGKSSLVFAGLIPALRKQPGTWQIDTLRAGADTVRLEPFVGAAPERQRRLVVIDQLEELFTVVEREARGRAIAAIEALSRSPATSVVCTLRADFFGELMDSALWPVAPEDRLEVAALRGPALAEAIARPAEAERVVIESALVERLVADSQDEPGALPFLQETLVMLWEHMHQRLITLAAYEALGSDGQGALVTAIARRADGALAELSEPDQVIARRILLRLVAFGEGRPDTRRRQPEAALRSAGDDARAHHRVLEHLAAQRLLTLSGAQDDDGRQVDLAHEALIAGWPTLRSWIAERRAGEATRRRLADKVGDRREGRRGLLDEVELPEARAWLDGPQARALGVPDGLAELVDESERAIAAARAARRRRIRRTVAGLAALSLFAVGVAVWALIQQREANDQRDLARSRELAALSTTERANDSPLTALTHAVEAYDLRPTPDAKEAVIDAVADPAVAVFRVASFSSGVAALADGRIATGGNEGIVQIIDPTGGGEPTTLAHGEARITSLAALPDGRIATGGIDGTVRVFGLSDGAQGSIVGRQEGGVTSVAALPDGRIASGGIAGTDGTVRIFDPSAPGEGIIVGRRQGIVWSVAALPQERIASGGVDGTVRVFDPARGGRHRVVGRHDGISRVATLPNGRIVSGGEDGTVRVFDPSGDEQGRIVVRLETTITTLATLPDGRVVTGGGDGAVRVLKPSGGGEGQVIGRHRGSVHSIAVLTDGRIATGGNDESVRIFDPAAVGDVRLAGRHKGATRAAALPDGRVVTGGTDGTVRVFDPAGGAPRVIGRHEDNVSSIAVLSDGLVASGGADGKVRLSDPTGGQDARIVGQHRGTVYGVAALPDGRIASGGFDGTVRIFDPATGEARIVGRHDGLSSVAVLPDGRIATGGTDRTVRTFETHGAGEDRIVGNRLGSLLSIAPLPDGRIATAGLDGTIRVLDQAEGGGGQVVGRHDGVQSVAALPDGQIVSGGLDGAVRVFDPASRGVGRVIGRQRGDVFGIAVLSDGRVASVGEDAAVPIWSCRICRPFPEILAAARSRIPAEPIPGDP